MLVPFTSTEKMWGKCGENQHLSHILSTCYQCSSHNMPIPPHYLLFNHFIPINYQLLNKLSSFSPLQNQHSINRSSLCPHIILCNVSGCQKTYMLCGDNMGQMLIWAKCGENVDIHICSCEPSREKSGGGNMV